MVTRWTTYWVVKGSIPGSSVQIKNIRILVPGSFELSLMEGLTYVKSSVRPDEE